jgi:hypothetical protein
MRKASLFTIFLIVYIDLIGFGILLPNQQLYGQLLGIQDKFYLTLIGPAYSFFSVHLCAHSRALVGSGGTATGFDRVAGGQSGGVFSAFILHV